MERERDRIINREIAIHFVNNLRDNIHLISHVIYRCPSSKIQLQGGVTVRFKHELFISKVGFTCGNVSVVFTIPYVFAETLLLGNVCKIEETLRIYCNFLFAKIMLETKGEVNDYYRRKYFSGN